MKPLLLTLLFLSGLAAGDTLRIAYGSHNGRPFAILDTTGAIASGIIHDIGMQLGERTGVPVAFVMIPRKRLEQVLQSGRASLYLKGNPDWLDEPEKLEWSAPLYEEEYVIVHRSDSFVVDSVSALFGKQLGTILGYHYTALDSLIARHKITRCDVKCLKSNMGKLLLGRIDCFVASDIQLLFELRSHPAADQFRIGAWKASHVKIRAAISPKAPLAIDLLRAHFDAMQSDGSIDSIMKRYR